jgi:hypothetical protein
MVRILEALGRQLSIVVDKASGVLDRLVRGTEADLGALGVSEVVDTEEVLVMIVADGRWV